MEPPREFHILLAGIEIGPLTERQVRAYLTDGLISPTDQSKRSDLAEWSPVADMLASLPPPPDAAGVPEQISLFPQDAGPSPVDVLAAAEPAYPLVPPAAPPVPATRETGALPKSSDYALLSSSAKTKRKPSRIVIQPMAPLNPAPVMEALEAEPDVAAPMLPAPALAPSVALPRKKSGIKAVVPPSRLNPLPQPAVLPEAIAPEVVSPDLVLTSPSLPRKRTPLRRARPLLIYSAAAILLVLVLPLAAYFLTRAKVPPTPEAAAAILQDEETRALASNPQTADGFTKRGIARKNRGDLDGAISDYDQALRLDANYVLASYRRGLAKLLKKDWDGAIADFSQVLGLDPRHADAFNSRAYAKQSKGDLDGAVADYTQALVINPKIAVAYYNRGMIKLQRGDRAGAILDFNHTLDLDPNMAFAYVNRADAKNADGNSDGAIADYTQALALNPKIVLAFSNRGAARHAKGDLDGAISDYTQALTLNPNLPATYYKRGLAFLSKGNLDGAIEDNTKSIELDPRDPSAYCNRGLALLGKGNLTGAKSDLRTFCQLAPHDPSTDDVRLYLWLIATEENPIGHANQELADVLLNDWNSAPDDLSTKIARFLLDRMGENDLFAAADSSDPAQDEIRHARANYFAGMKRLFLGDEAAAADDFQKVRQSESKDFPEYVFALVRLHALNRTPAPAH